MLSQYRSLVLFCFHESCLYSFAFYLHCFFQFVNRNLLLSFLFQKFVNFLFIVMTFNAKGLWYFLSFVVNLFLWKFPSFLKQWFSCRRGFLFAFNKNFFHVFHANHITFEHFLTLSMVTFMSPESKWNSHMSALFTLNLSFSPLRQNLDMLCWHCFFLLGLFGKWRKKQCLFKSWPCYPLCFACFCSSAHNNSYHCHFV